MDDIEKMAMELTENPCISRSYEKSLMKETPLESERIPPRPPMDWTKDDLNSGINSFVKLLKKAKQKGIIEGEQFTALVSYAQQYFKKRSI